MYKNIMTMNETELRAKVKEIDEAVAKIQKFIDRFENDINIDDLVRLLSSQNK